MKLLIFSQHLKQNKHLQGDKKFINLLDGKNNAKIKFLFEDSEFLLEKFRQAQKFQENNQNKYIYFLIYKMQNMIKENNNLRESVNKLELNIFQTLLYKVNMLYRNNK